MAHREQSIFERRFWEIAQSRSAQRFSDKELLEARAADFPPQSDPIGAHAFAIACHKHPNAELAKVLIERLGYDPDACFHWSMGQSASRPLCIALGAGRWDTAAYLASKAKDPTAADGAGRPPLLLASAAEYDCAAPMPSELLLRLVELGCDPHWRSPHGGYAEGSNLLACFAWDAQACRTLASIGVDPNVQNVLGNTPLMFACGRANLHSALALIEAGADPKIANLNGSGPLHALCCALTQPMQRGARERVFGEDRKALESLLALFAAHGLGFDQASRAIRYPSRGLRAAFFDVDGHARSSMSEAPVSDPPAACTPRAIMDGRPEHRADLALMELMVQTREAARAPSARRKSL